MTRSLVYIHSYVHELMLRDLERRGQRVQARARRLLAGEADHPRRVDTGALRADIRVTTHTDRVRIGTRRSYARWVHDGTGIYGPRRRVITPRRARALAFRGRGGGRVIVRSVKGMRPNRFLRDALIAARD